MKRSCLSLLLTVALAACAPADGPTTSGVVSKANQNEVPILQLDAATVAALGPVRKTSSLSGFSGQSYVPGIIKPGDTISVSVFDTGESGLFSATDVANVSLGEFAVSSSGTVSLPFIGTVNVGGRSVNSAQQLLTDKLRETSVNPSATVNILRKESDSYAVQGSVASGGTYDLTARSERLLDGIAAAGGAQGAPEETIVTLVRGSKTGSQSLASIIASPDQNVAIQPGDVIIVGGGEASFIADGALPSTGEFNFVEGDFTLAQAVAQAGGLSDSRSNPRAVFVFRRMPEGESFILRDTQGNQRRITGDVIFRANFRDPSERLRANRFQMRDGDVLYVGNAPLANFSKFFQIFNSPPEIPAVPEL
ncbi:polysaccharide biosynthesis/export family protein [Tabrizicola sp.]|uniref:polysaccharide biosynthesis/export family protein n=1 Tax=Tabrizicola sp. TaxID=2005166 RepID=UPI003F2F4A1C